MKQSVLITGASGVVGTALLQLGKLANLTMYGIASPSKHDILTEYGATPIDYHTQDFVEVIRQAEPGQASAPRAGSSRRLPRIPCIRTTGGWRGLA